MMIFGERHLRMILAEYEAHCNGDLIAAAGSAHHGPTTLPPIFLRCESSVGPSSAASSTNTSGSHRSPGQGGWLSSETPQVWNQRHLMTVLREYEDFYNTHRPHRTLNQAAPLRPLPDGVASLDHFRVRRRDRAGSVIHEYRLVA
jgi:hypothetical protein